MSSTYELAWEIGVILECYANSSRKDKKDLYAKAILINTKMGYGIVYVLDDFIDEVKNGFYVDGDGCGYALDGNGERLCAVGCNLKFLEKLKDSECVFVAWFNK